MGHDYLTVADMLGMHTVLMKRYGGAWAFVTRVYWRALLHPQTGYEDDFAAE